MVNYIILPTNGTGAPFIEGLGRVCAVVSRNLTMLLLVLLGKGWMISKPNAGNLRWVLYVFGVVGANYIALVMVYAWAVENNPVTTYIYDTCEFQCSVQCKPHCLLT